MKDVIRYTVKVTATTERVEKVGKEWRQVDGKPESKYDYTPEIEKTMLRSEQVYEQTVDTLDMAALVKVVNNIPA